MSNGLGGVAGALFFANKARMPTKLQHFCQNQRLPSILFVVYNMTFAISEMILHSTRKQHNLYPPHFIIISAIVMIGATLRLQKQSITNNYFALVAISINLGKCMATSTTEFVLSFLFTLAIIAPYFLIRKSEVGGGGLSLSGRSGFISNEVEEKLKLHLLVLQPLAIILLGYTRIIYPAFSYIFDDDSGAGEFYSRCGLVWGVSCLSVLRHVAGKKIKIEGAGGTAARMKSAGVAMVAFGVLSIACGVSIGVTPIGIVNGVLLGFGGGGGGGGGGGEEVGFIYVYGKFFSVGAVLLHFGGE